MTDLTYCYLHMSEAEIDSLDHIVNGEMDYWDFYLSDEGELHIPAHLVPPDPDDTEILPSNIHPSYPYGDPTRPDHVAQQPNRPRNPNARSLYEDSTQGATKPLAGLIWKDLALDLLLPRDPAKEEAAAAENARKVANGAQQAEPDPQETFDHTFESTFFDGTFDQTIDQDEEIEIPRTEELESSETQDEASQGYEEGSEADEEED